MNNQNINNSSQFQHQVVQQQHGSEINGNIQPTPPPYGQCPHRPPSDDGDDDENDTIEEEDEEEEEEGVEESGPVPTRHQHPPYYHQHQYTTASPGRSISQNRTRALRYRKAFMGKW